jgi:hypothetical protein
LFHFDFSLKIEWSFLMQKGGCRLRTGRARPKQFLPKGLLSMRGSPRLPFPMFRMAPFSRNYPASGNRMQIHPSPGNSGKIKSSFSPD